jgi:predicted lipid-binding transport protein (Tim44 family)
MGRAVAWLVGGLAGLLVAGWIGVKLLGFLFGGLEYLLVGAVLVGGGLYVYGRVRRGLAPGSRNQLRLEAAARTYRMRRR